MIISVISIAYNNLKGLRKTLEVFESGDFAHQIEIVIVDGGSDDGTKDFLQQQQLTDNWVSEKDNGIYNAMNKGLKMAKGEYVWFLNSGDYVLDKEVINAILKALNDKPDAIYGETMFVDVQGNPVGTRSDRSTRRLPAILNWKSFQLGMSVSHQSFVVKKSLTVSYNEDYQYVADIDWMINCLKNCKKVVNLNRIIACFTLDGFSSANRQRSNKERYSVLQKHYGFIPNLWNHLRIVLRKVFQPSGL